MEILIVAATPPETILLRETWGLGETLPGARLRVGLGKTRISLLHTGIGMVNTAYHLGRCFLEFKPDLAIQVGIAGSFPGGPGIGDVVEVSQECFSELGAESPEGFLDLETMGFENFRAQSGLYFNEMANPAGNRTDLPACRGITVNTVHGKADEIELALERWNPQVESMEGAPFFQCCLMSGVPFLELRGISNRVEPRNRAAWKIREASEAVQRFCLAYLQAEGLVP